MDWRQLWDIMSAPDNVPIVAMTAAVMEEDRRACQRFAQVDI